MTELIDLPLIVPTPDLASRPLSVRARLADDWGLKVVERHVMLSPRCSLQLMAARRIGPLLRTEGDRGVWPVQWVCRCGWRGAGEVRGPLPKLFTYPVGG